MLLKEKLYRFAQQLAPYSHAIPLPIRRSFLGRFFGGDRIVPLPFAPGKYPDGINLFGLFSAQIGLTQGARIYAEALTHARIESALVDVRLAGEVTKNPMLGAGESPRYSVNLIHLNPDEYMEARRMFPRSFWDMRYNIGVWLWELSDMPVHWAEALPFLNEIWAPTRFVADAIQKETSLPVRVIPYGMRTISPAPRSHFLDGIPAGAFVALAMYDTRSGAARKNPEAAIRAFMRAFPRETGKNCLIVKINYPTQTDQAALHRIIGGRRDIRLVAETISKPEVDALVGSCDAFVSLHRAEGYGLVIAEAMSMGIPVVATGYSGNMDFMDADCSLLVPYRLVSVDEQYPFAAPDAVWAEPDVEEAAALLHRLSVDARYRHELGERGRRRIMDAFSMESCASALLNRYNEILEIKR
jgi:glycosyltransferase involved in cell wall biosynthesis